MNEYLLDDLIEIFSLSMLSLSLISIWLGHFSSTRVRFKCMYRVNQLEFENDIRRKKTLEKLSMYCFWITFPMYVLNYKDRISYVMAHGYLEYYKSYTGVSPIIAQGTTACTFAFFLFLACFPQKKRVLPIIIAYILANAFSILAGQRGNMVVAIVFSLFYFLLRQGRNPEEKWIKKLHIRIGLIAIPLLFAFLSYWTYVRSETIKSNMNLFDYLFDFIGSNGSSSEIIGYAKQNVNTLKHTGYHSYTFGYFIRLFTGFYAEQSSVKMANSGTSLGATITYLTNSYMFLRGGGMGTCYIAEVWVDFGIVGVIIYNFILGFVLTKMSRINFENTIGTLLSFVIISKVFMLPRSEALCMLQQLTSRMLIFLLIAIILLKAGMASWSRANIQRCEG